MMIRRFAVDVRPVPSILSVAALLAGLLAASPGAARAEGRITFTKATVQGCSAMGKCVWRITCQTGREQLVQDVRGVSRDVKEIAKSYDTQAFPVNVQCKLDIDDGLFTTKWKEVGKAGVTVPGGGDWDLEMANKENGGVTVHVTADSLEMGGPAAAPAAPAKGKPAKAASKAASQAPGGARQYVAVFQASQQGEAILVGFPWDQFKARADQLDAGGVHIVALDTYVDGGRRLWSGIFQSGAEKQLLLNGLAFEEFTKKYKGLVVDQHMRLVDVVVYDEGAKRQIGAAFREGYDNPAPPWFLEQKAFEAKVTELGGQGQRLRRMDVFRSSGNKLNYAGVFREGTGSYGLWTGLDHDAFLAKWKKASDSGTQINEVKTYADGKKRLYDAVIGGGGTKTQVALDLDAKALAAKWRESFGKGYRIVGLETYQD
jgi:Bacterial tandem repeat domain 1